MSMQFLFIVEVAIVFTSSGFEFYEVKYPWLHRQWWVAPNSLDLNPRDYQLWGQCWSVAHCSFMQYSLSHYQERV